MQEELKRIAGRVKAWRTKEGLTLQEVSERSGVSASTVHKIENLQMIPTIAVLLKVAHGLGRRPHELFDEGAVTRSTAAHVRAGERDQLQTREGSTLERVVGAIDQAEIDVWRVSHDPGRGSQPSPDAPRQRYRGEVVILVETGRLHVEVGEGETIEAYDLDVGDTLHFKTSVPHAWINRTEEPVSAYFFGLLPQAARRLD